jgi:WhiB family redox-sensing transcriptional regulator
LSLSSQFGNWRPKLNLTGPYLHRCNYSSVIQLEGSSVERNQVPANWFVDVLKLGVAKAYGSEIDGDPLAWQEDALCAQTDPEAFFPEKGGSTRDAKRICAQCTVRAECLEYALKNDERFGIWGGLSERERRRLRRRA